MRLWNNIVLEDPWFLLLLLLIPLFLYWHYFRKKGGLSSIKMTNLSAIKSSGWMTWLRHLLFLLKIAAFTLLVFALARPQRALQDESINSEGIDIVIAMDVSGSMLARDFQPDRLEASKFLGQQFIDKRPFDRIGLVVFAAESFTQCPITSDHQVLKKLFSEVKNGYLEDGTAIGMGLATSVSRLKESKAASKVVVLMTDGVNNSGFIDPSTAAETAKQFGIKVYTIGVGTEGTAPYPVKNFFGSSLRNIKVEIDEELLEDIADQTGGKYFRAKDNRGLQQIYNEIDRLEKTEIEVTRIKRYSELFHNLAIWALVCGVLYLLLNYTLLRRIS